MSKKYISLERLALTVQEIKEKFVRKETGKGLFSGKYADLTEKPVIPTKISQLQNDSAYVDETALSSKGYLEASSISSWAKAAEKPTYTAAETGALPADTAIPGKVSDLANDSEFQSASQVTTAITRATENLASKNYVAEQLAAAPHLKRAKVSALPGISSADENTIYMVPKSGSGGDVYSEYMLIEGKYELIGSSTADLTGYIQETDEATEADITAIFAGW